MVLSVQLSPAITCVMAPLVEGAGGCMTDWEGRPLKGLGMSQEPQRIIAAANFALAKSMHSVLRDMLSNSTEFPP